jgi:hypothetical protein
MNEQYNNLTNNNEQPVTPPAQTQKSNRNKIILIICILAVVGLAAVALFILLNKPTEYLNTNQPQNESPTQAAQSLFLQQNGNGCKERDVAFTSAPMKMEELAYIRPLGAMSDGHVTPTDHVYIGGPNPNAPDNTYAVLMPADGTITAVAAMPAQYIGDRSGQQVAAEDHRIVVSHSCRYFSIFIHIHKLSDAVTAAVGKLQPNENKQASIELKAGDVIGYIGGSTFDWTPLDTTTTLKGFITPSRYDGESWKIHTVSPFDLYKGELKAQLEAKSLRSVAPIGGKIDYDQPGKLIGNWFREGTGGYTGPSGNNGGRYWDAHLSVVPDYIDPASTIVSTGNWNGSAKQMVVKGTHDPSAVGEQQGMIKYELLRLNYINPSNPMADARMPTKGMKPSQTGALEGTILLQVLPGEKLKVETFPGKSAAQVSGFTATAQMYER